MKITDLKNLFKGKDKKNITYFIVILAAGILFVALSFAKKPGGGSRKAETESLAGVQLQSSDFEAETEQRLAEVLSLVAGAGKVKVMVTLSQNSEIVVAADVKLDESKTSENDGQGGFRENYTSKKSEETLLIKGTDGAMTPVVLKEITPKIEGVLIVAQGGGDAHVKQALTHATQIVLGVEPHKVQVLKMK